MLVALMLFLIGGLAFGVPVGAIARSSSIVLVFASGGSVLAALMLAVLVSGSEIMDDLFTLPLVAVFLVGVKIGTGIGKSLREYESR
ncbi:MAG: hypothetical protein R3E64_05945 [Halioglobus sp.]